MDLQTLVNSLDLTKASTLLTEFNNLNRFEEVERFDNESKFEKEKLQTFIEDLNVARKSIVENLDAEKRLISEKSFFARIFSSSVEKKNIKILNKNLATLDNLADKISNLIEALDDAISKTPDSPAEAKEMIKDLKLIKKELTQQKKEINSNMREIRVESRQNSVYLTGGGKFGKAARMSARLQKESALRPHETEKASLDRQILNIERTILWIEKFK